MATTSTHPAILTPEQVTDLVILPVSRDSIAGQVSTIHNTGTHELRVPRVTADPAAEWVPEGGEIAVSDADVDEVIIEHAKLAALSVVSSELAADTNPAAVDIIGAGIVRDLTRKLDAAYFGALEAPAPSGLDALTDVTEVTATAITSLDPFAEAAAAAADHNTTIDAWVAHPDDALAIAQLKTATGSNQALLAPSGDATASARRVIEGAPLHVSANVTAGTIWGIPKTASIISIREDAEVTADHSAFFTSDRVAIRGILRVGFGFINEPAIVKVTID